MRHLSTFGKHFREKIKNTFPLKAAYFLFYFKKVCTALSLSQQPAVYQQIGATGLFYSCQNPVFLPSFFTGKSFRPDAVLADPLTKCFVTFSESTAWHPHAALHRDFRKCCVAAEGNRNFIVDSLSAIAACCRFEKKPAIDQYLINGGQPAIFWFMSDSRLLLMNKVHIVSMTNSLKNGWRNRWNVFLLY